MGAGNGTLKNEFTFNNLTFEENGVSLRGTAKTNLDINTLNLKLGYKTGGTIYFRIEAGYGIGTIPDALNFTATSGGITETFSEDIPAIPRHWNQRIRYWKYWVWIVILVLPIYRAVNSYLWH